jgi:hypothetical protein
MNADLLSKLLWGSVINSATDLVPAYICVCKEAFVYRRRRRQCKQDWSEWTKLVIHLAAFFNVLGLECDLQATTPHTKSHRIHINVVDLCGPISDVIVLWPLVKVIVDSRIVEWPWSFLIFENRHVYLNFSSSS